jgi:hypothetical protein
VLWLEEHYQYSMWALDNALALMGLSAAIVRQSRADAVARSSMIDVPGST